ncbi:unnamed protein product [Phytophthora lilii]|uniref:Unnamed protein product n=1 Tax=Phytophthora lilii TaxID=2077276 RepID=A0A9W6TS65_9STRA|nr:unnamed protein product [Phytophthora lilii]
MFGVRRAVRSMLRCSGGGRQARARTRSGRSAAIEKPRCRDGEPRAGAHAVLAAPEAGSGRLHCGAARTDRVDVRSSQKEEKEDEEEQRRQDAQAESHAPSRALTSQHPSKSSQQIPVPRPSPTCSQSGIVDQ